MNAADVRKLIIDIIIDVLSVLTVIVFLFIVFGMIYIPISSGIQYSNARRRLYGKNRHR